MSKQAPNPVRLAELIDSRHAGDEKSVAPEWDFNPEKCGDFDFRIARDGTWFYRGAPIRRKSLCKLFSSAIRRSAAGGFFLVTPTEQGRIEVEDAPFAAVEVIAEGTGRDQTITFRTNLDQMVTAGPDRPIRVSEDPESGEPAPYVLVRDDLEALILRPQFYQLVEMAEERGEGDDIILGVWSRGAFFSLGRVGPEAPA